MLKKEICNIIAILGKNYLVNLENYFDASITIYILVLNERV